MLLYEDSKLAKFFSTLPLSYAVTKRHYIKLFPDDLHEVQSTCGYLVGSIILSGQLCYPKLAEFCCHTI